MRGFIKTYRKHFIYLICLLFLSCMDEDKDKPIACAGPDQVSMVGSYVLMDPSCSEPGKGGMITWYEWKQDEGNPEEVPFFSSHDCWIQHIGFLKEGIYRFSLQVKDGVNGTESDWDQITIKVKPREEIIFKDPALEVHIRRYLKVPKGELTPSLLSSLDTLYSNFTLSRKINSLKGIENCVNLKCLSMSLQNITDIFPLANLAQLTRLDLDQNHHLSDISPLSGFTNLRYLDLNTNDISNISPLSNLTQLRYLDLDFNPITDISALSDMKEMEVLFIHSPICDISPLSGMKKMVVLRLSSCDITDVTPLKDMTNLRQLVLSLNNIVDISSLEGLVKLVRLDLDGNSIRDISALENMTSIITLDLQVNQISDILPLVNNSGLNRGDIVNLINNPLSDTSINEYIPILRERGVYVNY